MGKVFRLSRRARYETARELVVRAADEIHYAAGQLEAVDVAIGAELRRIADRLHALAKQLRD